jgi:2'-5' RNA ligase
LAKQRDAVDQMWLIFPPPEVTARALSVQQSFRAFDWIAPVPEHLLHVSVAEAVGVGVDHAERAWRDVEPFELAYRRANCFHDAAIIEVHGEGVAMLVERAFPQTDLSLLLPHMSVGYFRRSETPEQLRRALAPFRDVDLGTGIVDEVFLCEVPIAESTFLRPWRVLGSVKLRAR